MMRRVLAVVLACVLLAPVSLHGQTLPYPTTTSVGGVLSFASGASICFTDVGLRRFAAGVLETDNCAGTAATHYAAKFTTTGVGTYNITVASDEVIGVLTGGTITLSTTPFVTMSGPAFTNTSQGRNGVIVSTTFQPGSGTGSYAGLNVTSTINGTSSGNATALAVASVTNTLTGGLVNLVDVGTTTSDYFTGYTRQFAVGVNGTATLSNSLMLASAATTNMTNAVVGSVYPSQVKFGGLNASAPNGGMVFCVDCDAALTMATCSSASTRTGAMAFRINGAWICGG